MLRYRFLFVIVALSSLGCPPGTSGPPDAARGSDAVDGDGHSDTRARDGTDGGAEDDALARDAGDGGGEGDARARDADDTTGEVGEGCKAGERDADGCDARSCEETNGGVEICDDNDNDCDGHTDEVCAANTTSIGGENTDRINAVASASSGVYFGGTTSGPLEGQSVSGNFDGFVGRLADDGSIDWLRVFGSDGSERIDALAVGPDGGVYGAGSGDSAFGDAVFQGQSDALVVKFDDTGDRQWVSFQGTETVEFGRAVDVLADGRVAVGYQSRDPFGDAGSEGKTAVLTPQGESEFSGSMGKDIRALAAGPSGTFAIGGEVTDGFGHDDTEGRGGGDGFVAVIDRNGGRRWARLVGGSGPDAVHDVAFDGQSVYAVGATESSVDGGTPDGRDGFVARLDGPDTRAWFEYVGGPGDDTGRSIDLAENGELFAVGTVAGEFAGETVSGDTDVWLSNMKGDGTRVGHHLYGSPEADVGRSISVGPNTSVIGGRTEGSFEGAAHLGGVDGFVVRLRGASTSQSN